MMKPFVFLLLFFSISVVPAQENKDSIQKRLPYQASTTRTHDLLHTSLDVKFDWEKSQLQAKATITGKTYFKPASTLTLDAKGMEIHSLEVYDLGKNKTPDLSSLNPEILKSKKLPATFKYENDSLRINLGKEFKGDEKYMIRMAYTAKPNELRKGGSAAISDDRGLYFINPKNEEKNKMPQIWTQGETQASSAWFPTIDSPNEKLVTEIFMTVDDKYTTLSNGKLMTSKKNADGTRTDHWKMDLPHSPYLVMMAVGEFVKVIDKPWNGKEISYYVEKEYEPYAKQIFGNTPEMIDFYSRVLGTPYPWQKYAQIVVRDYVSGAMENTSATLHGDFMVYQNDREMEDGKKGEAVIAHELFHQWFGDLVTAESWSNLPLNESFATYGEYLWEEYKNGRDAADDHSFSSRSGYFQESKNKKVELIRYHYDNREDMFDAHSYNKGGQILHMLRKYVGDEAFFASLKLYLEQNKFKSAEVHDLRLAFEEVTGEDLNWFFNQWFLGKGHPELEISKKYDAGSKKLSLRVVQKQDLKENPLFRLPVEVDIYDEGKKERRRIDITQADQTFEFTCETEPELVNFDAERQLLSAKTYTKSEKEYLYQYHHAPLFMDRYEALYNLEGKGANQEVYETFVKAVEHDPYWSIRSACFSDLKEFTETRKEEVKTLVSRIARKDKNSNVRATAIHFLASNYKDPDLMPLYDSVINAKSYAVATAALRGIASLTPEKALLKAKDFENEKTPKVFYAVSGLYGSLGNDNNSDYFVKSQDYFSGAAIQSYIYQYDRFLPRCEQASSYETAASILSGLSKHKNEHVKAAAKKVYQKTFQKTLPEKIDELKKKNADVQQIASLEQTQKKLQEDYKAIESL